MGPLSWGAERSLSFQGTGEHDKRRALSILAEYRLLVSGGEMSINAKATIFMSNSDNQGWSESHYGIFSDINSAQTQLNTLLTARVALLGINSQIIYARVSDEAIKGDSLLPTFSLPAEGTWVPATGAQRVSADVGLLCQEFASSTKKNHFFLRDLDSGTVHGTDYINPSGWASLITAYFAALEGSWAVRNILSHGPPKTYQYTAINTCRVVGVRSRKPGRPFGLPVGRRRP